MNDIIAWIAHNNTLLIRIGFTAVILLLIVYVFRLFFVPRASETVAIVTDAASNEVAKSQAPASNDEIVKLQAEISTLKFKLKEAEVEKAALVTAQQQEKSSIGEQVNPVSGEDSAVRTADAASVSNADAAAEAELNKQLNEKIKSLESRLAEYEIIAEDIAEISILRTENDHLKNKLHELEGRLNIAVDQPSSSEVENSALGEIMSSDFDEPVDGDVVSEEVLKTDKLGDLSDRDLLEAELAAEADKVMSASSIEEIPSEDVESTSLGGADHVVIKSDDEVTTEEQDILNEFENFKKTKKG